MGTLEFPTLAGNPAVPGYAPGNYGEYGFQFSLAHDTRDNGFLPTEGHLIQFSFEEVLGRIEFPRGNLTASQYYKLYERPDGSGRHVLSLSATMGVTAGNTPIFERFYLGGFSSIRGFSFRGVSPRIDVPGPVPGTTIGTMNVGGDFELFTSVQYLFPITADDMLRGVVFCDAGTVEPTIHNWSDRFRVAPGVGLRIVVPMMGPAPIALDFAFPVALNHGDEVNNFSFFVGFLR